MTTLLVGVGGAIGSILRYWAGGLVQQAAGGAAAFPAGTLLVNVIGCVAIGAVAQLAEQRSSLGADARVFLMVGLLGGFTTFSAFANETMTAWRSGAVLVAAVNVVLSVGACLAGVAAGRAAIAAFVK